jgi:hypothetical protein
VRLEGSDRLKNQLNNARNKDIAKHFILLHLLLVRLYVVV